MKCDYWRRVLRAALMTNLMVAAAGALVPANAAPDEPFAPAGTELVRVETPDRAAVQRLIELGLHPEGGGSDFLYVRVTPAELDRLHRQGFRATEAKRGDSPSLPFGAAAAPAYTSYDQMVADLNQIATDYPDLTYLTTCGQSVQGRDIWALKITRYPDIEESEPEVRIIGAHHGNERMSVEISLRMAHYLVDNYGVDSTVTALVDSREIWIVPMMNPDGVQAGSRYNAHGVDLNRNYGYMWEYGGSTYFSEPETRAVRELATDNWFILSLSFHTTAAYVNSVWNYSPHYTEDDDVIWTLTVGYAGMSGYTPIHGWEWYETHGDCNDWSYGARADFDWTIETANTNEDLVWSKNRDGILYIFDAAGWGIHGVVTDAVTGEPLRARISVGGNGWPAFSDPSVGDYHKPLLAGNYELTISANGYQDLFLPSAHVPVGGGVTVNAQLTPGGGHYADRVEIACVADPNNTYANPTLTMSMLGAPDGVGCSLGRGGEAVLDLGAGSEARDIVGADLEVFESIEDAAVDGFQLYGGDSYLGPWTFIGSGTGNTSFDLSASGLSLVRYLRVVDDGDGVTNDPHAGFDLDAIESFGGLATWVDDGLPRDGSGAPLALFPPSPNPLPAGSRAAILFQAPASDRSRLGIFDARGRLVVSLAEGCLGPGPRTILWDGRDDTGSPVATGIYLVRLATRDASSARKLLVLR